MNELSPLPLLIGEPGTTGATDGRAVLEVRSPANGEVVGAVETAGPGDVDRAVQVAHRAFLAWSAQTAYQREQTIRRATAHVRGRAAEIGELMAREQGKPADQARGEVVGACDTIDYYAAEGVRVEGYTNPTEHPQMRSWVAYQPVGVCALITPWNYPVSLLSWKLGPCLAAGCAAVVKPTEVTPMSPLAFCRALVEGGLPAGLVNVLSGPGSPVGEELIRHPLVKKVAMTGSTATGKRLLALCAPFLKKISLELGGNCPAIVCPDADLDAAAKVIAYKAFRNMGQSCSAVARVYAHRTVREPLVARLRTLAEKLTIGDGVSDGAVDLGPLTTRRGLETVRAHVADARERGATLVCGGRAPEGEAFARGFFYLPTILTDATPAMRVVREETFGPVVPFVDFDDPDGAVAQANDSEHGLVAYLFTRDFATTTRVSEALESGTVCVNHGAVNTNYGPYAGWKDSGFGLELSRRAIYEYLNTKHIKVQMT